MKTKIIILLLLVALVLPSIMHLFECNKTEKPISPQDCYYSLLHNMGYSLKDYFSEEEIQAYATKFKKQFSGKTDEEILEEVRASMPSGAPDKKFIPFVEDVLNNLPQEYSNSSLSVFAGELPLSQFEASVSKSSDNGYLIIFSKGFTRSIIEWSKLFVNVGIHLEFIDEGIDIETPEVKKMLENEEVNPDTSLSALVKQFKTSIINYVEKGEVPRFANYTTDSKGYITEALSSGALHFVIAHEIAHILIGDLKTKEPINCNSLNAGCNYDFDSFKESEIDELAIDLLLNNINFDTSANNTRISNPEFAIAGALFCTGLMQIIENRRSKKEFSPNYLIRTIQLMTHLDAVVSGYKSKRIS